MSLFASAARSLAVAATALLATPAHAHPHVFIDAGLEVIFDDKGRLTHVRVSWRYDDFYSLLIAEDRKIDTDGDGNTDAGEEVFLAGFDTYWSEGYNGDLVVRLGDRDLKLSGPLQPTASMRDGRVTSSHLRKVAGKPKLRGSALSMKVFDESYYTAYDLKLPVRIIGADCDIKRVEPDIDGELASMQAMLQDLDIDVDLEQLEIPMIGEQFAEDVQISCS